MTDKIYTPRSFTLIQYRVNTRQISMGHVVDRTDSSFDIIYSNNFDDLLKQLKSFAYSELERDTSDFNCEYILLLDGVDYDNIYIISDVDGCNEYLFNKIQSDFEYYKKDIYKRLKFYVKEVETKRKEDIKEQKRLEREAKRLVREKTKIEKDKEKFNELKNKYGW